MLTLNKSTYDMILKFLSAGAAVTMMGISASFSVDGFSFQSPDKVLVGWLLAIILIIVEMGFNNNPPDIENPDKAEARRATILMLAGFVAYGYGIATNISGIIHSGRMPDNPLDYVVPVALGLFLEIVPEPLMVWALLTPNKKYPPPKNTTWKPSYSNDNQSEYQPTHKINPEFVQKLKKKYSDNA